MHLAFHSLSNGGAISALGSPLDTLTHIAYFLFFPLWISKEKERELQLLTYSHSKKPVLRSVINMATKQSNFNLLLFALFVLKVIPCARALYDYEPKEAG